MHAAQESAAMSVFRWIFAVIAIALLLSVADGTLLRWGNMPPRPVIVKPIEPDSELSHLMYEAGKASRAENHQRAAELYTKALDIEPGPDVISQDLHALRGSEYNYLGMPEKAYADFDAAIRTYYYRVSDYYRMSDRAIRAYMGRGYAAMNLNQYARAKTDFDVVLKELPNDVPRSSSTLAWRGGTWQGLGDREHALADYKAALALDPKNGHARKALKDLGEP
jgi:tetratricopeptide (TPR) repeat protein